MQDICCIILMNLKDLRFRPTDSIKDQKIIAEKLMDFQSSTSANILINIPLKF